MRQSTLDLLTQAIDMGAEPSALLGDLTFEADCDDMAEGMLQRLIEELADEEVN
jgi:hypothetical protein